MSDAIDMLISDHRMVDSLFEECLACKDTAKLEELQKKIISELSVHAAVEEMLVYPTARRILKSDQVVDHSIEEHHKMKVDLEAWEKLKPNDAQFRPQLDKIIKDVRHHVKEEESQVLPNMRQNTTADQRTNMGTIMTGLKKVAPSRPHPEQPQTMPGAALAGMLNAFWDGLKGTA